MNTKRSGRLFLSAVVLMLFAASALLAGGVFAATGVNKQVPYQGTLKTSAGANVTNGNYDMVFRIYDAAVSGNTLWTGTYTTVNGNPVSVANGLFRVLLGSGTGNAMTLGFNSDTYWLGVTIGSDSEMAPRQRIGAAGYALNADTVDGIGFATTTLNVGDILYASASNLLQRLGAGTNGEVLKLSSGLPSWGSDLQGPFSTTADSLVVHPTDTSDVLVLGGNATTTTGNIFEVSGNSFFTGDGIFSGLFTAYNTVTAPIFTATSTSATSTFSGGLAVGSNSFNVLQNGNVGIGTMSPADTLDVNGDILISNADIPMGLQTETLGTTPVLNLDVNFRTPGTNTAYKGAAFRIDTRDGYPVFQWITRLAGSLFEPTQMALTEGGNLGIGTSSPVSRLAVSGGASIGANYNIAAPTNGLIVEGNVGIGTANPVGLLHLKKDAATFTPALYLENDGGGNLDRGTGLLLSARDNSGFKAGLAFEDTTTWGKGTLMFLNRNSNDSSNADKTDARMVITYTGNIGIGTTSPFTTFGVSGDSYFTGAMTLAGPLSAQATSTFAKGVSLANATPDITSNALYNNGGALYWNGAAMQSALSGTEGQTLVFDSAGSPAATSTLFVTSAGNVGIGTTTPQYSLTIQGQGANADIHLYSTGGDQNGWISRFTNRLSINSDDMITWGTGGQVSSDMLLDSNGNLGIGTTGASEKLEVEGNVKVRSGNYLKLYRTGNDYGWEINDNSGNDLVFKSTSLSSPTLFLSDNSSKVGIGTTSPLSRLAVAGGVSIGANYNIAAPTDGLIVEGNVGIGTVTPSSKLHIASSDAVQGMYIAMTNTTSAYTGLNIYTTGVATQSVLSVGSRIAGAGDYINGLTVNTNGKVGIGTTTPTRKLTVRVNTDDGIDISAINSPNMRFMTDITGDARNWMFASQHSISGFELLRSTVAGGIPNTSVMVFDKNGNVGIGTTNPGAKLSVAGRIAQSGLGGSTFIGEGAGANDDLSANNNVAVGYQALSSNTNSYGNTAIGYQSLSSNITGGIANTAVGSQSLKANTTGDYNASFGYQALLANTTGSHNTALGGGALSAATSSDGNTAIGSHALTANTTGYNNTANGYQSLYSNTTGYNNTANGYMSLRANGIGRYNTANGYMSLTSNTTGNYNTALGMQTLISNVTGNQNIALGYGSDVSAGNLNNATVIGYNASVDASNKVRIGNSFVTVIEGQVAWSTPSDRRLKENIQDSTLGLDFINKLKPVTYNLKKGQEGILYTGLIAQDVEEALGGTEFSGLVKPQNENDFYSLRYSTFVVPLINAVQDQQGQIEVLQNQLNSLTLGGTVAEFITDQENGGTLSVNRVIAKEELCIGDAGNEVCLNKDELTKLKALISESSAPTSNPAPSNEKPVITILGDNPLTVTEGNEFTDPRAKANDAEDGNITPSIVVGGDTVSSATPAGTYSITYNVSDSEGLAADEAVRTVTVAENSSTTTDVATPNEKPVITILGDNPLTVTEGNEFTDPRAKANDAEDGNITPSIVVGGDTVSSTTPAGTYTITYNVSDAEGLAADEAVRTVVVEAAQDTVSPVITLKGEAAITLAVGDSYTDEGATANDDTDGDITSDIITGGDTVSSTTPAGTYTITYNVSDSAGNAATEVTRAVTVEAAVKDQTADATN